MQSKKTIIVVFATLLMFCIFSVISYQNKIKRERKACLAFVYTQLIDYESENGTLPNTISNALKRSDWEKLIKYDSRMATCVTEYDGSGGFVYSPTKRFISLNYKNLENILIEIKKAHQRGQQDVRGEGSNPPE